MESITFELKHGIEKDGQRHTTVEMRPMLTGDIKVLNRDRRVQELAKGNHEIDITGLAGSSMATVTEQILTGSRKVDPVRMQYVQSATAEVYSILFARTITRIGDITQINPAIFDALPYSDFTRLIQHHNELNTPEMSPEDKREEPNGPLP